MIKVCYADDIVLNDTLFIMSRFMEEPLILRWGYCNGIGVPPLSLLMVCNSVCIVIYLSVGAEVGALVSRSWSTQFVLQPLDIYV